MRTSIIPFTVEGLSPHIVAAVLGSEYGIGVRSGCFCAQPYVVSLLGLRAEQVERLRTLAKGRKHLLPGFVRISLAFYNTTDEIDAFCNALEDIAARKFGKYTFDQKTSRYVRAIHSGAVSKGIY